jgi:hypothetical protein
LSVFCPWMVRGKTEEKFWTSRVPSRVRCEPGSLMVLRTWTADPPQAPKQLSDLTLDLTSQKWRGYEDPPVVKPIFSTLKYSFITQRFRSQIPCQLSNLRYFQILS